LFPNQTFKDIALGIVHACCLTEEGKVITWGLNSAHVIGNPKLKQGKVISTDSPYHLQFVDSPTIVSVNVYNCTNIVLSDMGKMYCWGVWKDEEVAKPIKFKFNKFVCKFAVGNGFIIAVTDDFQIWTGGLNKNGEVTNFFYLYIFIY
jgi:alpha-tubulin suppressor-like RCC1 family protein